MKRALIASVCALALAACERTEQAPPADEAREQSLILSCDAFRDASADTLAAAYGAENLVDQVVPGPEGETYTATVLFPNDAARRLEITWRDEVARVGPASLAVSGEGSTWTGPNGLALGQTVAEVETANGRASSSMALSGTMAGAFPIGTAARLRQRTVATPALALRRARKRRPAPWATANSARTIRRCAQGMRPSPSSA